METLNQTTESTDLLCQYCSRECKSYSGKLAHERHCKQNPAKQQAQEKPETPKALTPEEAAIVSRIDTEDIEWFNLADSELNDFSLMDDPLLLPKAAQKLQNEKIYAFRWCERTPQRMDQLCKSQQPPLRWAVVNKSTLHELSGEVDDTLGCVCRLDQLLLFKPWAHHARVKAAKLALADNLDRSGQLKSREKKSDESYNYTADKKHKINAGDDIHFDEASDDTEDTTDLGDLVVNE